MKKYILTEFLVWLDDKNYDEKTIDRYERYIVRFNDFLFEYYQITINEPENFHIKMLDNYISHLLGKYAPKTINLMIASIRSYMKYCDRMDYCQYDYRRIGMIKEDDKEAIFVNKEDFETILARISFHEKDRLTRLRDILICKFLFVGMLRVSETCNIKLSDFNVIGNDIYLQVVGKGKVLRTIPIQRKIYEQVLEYTNLRWSKTEYVFISHAKNSTGTKLSRNAVAGMIKKYRELCGITKKITPHSFRHGGATHMIAFNPPLVVVQKQLGHKHITTTQKYTHIVNYDLTRYQEIAFSE